VISLCVLTISLLLIELTLLLGGGVLVLKERGVRMERHMGKKFGNYRGI